MAPAAALALAVALVAAAGCRDAAPGGPGAGAAGLESESAGWVRIYDPERAANGYTLAFFEQQIPMLIDMNGRIVHAWPEVRARSRLRLTPECTLLYVALDYSVGEVTWDGDTVLRYELGETLPHHDLLRLTNGNTLLLLREPDASFDDLREIDAQGRIVWEWKGAERLAAELERLGFTGYTHANSIRELPENPWFDAGDGRFRPGNLLVSARDPNLVFIIERRSGEVVWSYRGELDAQHEALMLGPEDAAPGRIQIFNNRRDSQDGDRRSELIEIDPRTLAVEWRYSRPGFFSATHGAGQPLPNGNVMIASSRGARAFEVDRQGRTVWEWAPPFLIRRPHRYPYDYCPRLEALPRPEELPVEPPSSYRFVDRDAYLFARPPHLRTRRFDGDRRRLLKRPRMCRRLLLPPEPLLAVSYGAEQSPAEARFRIWLEVGGERQALLDEVLAAGASEWREARLDLSRWQLEEIRLCLLAESPGAGGTGRHVFWGEPRIRSRAPWQKPLERMPKRTDLTDAERRAQEQHLRAMGYVN